MGWGWGEWRERDFAIFDLKKKLRRYWKKRPLATTALCSSLFPERVELEYLRALLRSKTANYNLQSETVTTTESQRDAVSPSDHQVRGETPFERMCPQLTCSISYNASFRTEMCTFLPGMVHRGYGRSALWDLWIKSIVTIQSERCPTLYDNFD